MRDAISRLSQNDMDTFDLETVVSGLYLMILYEQKYGDAKVLHLASQKQEPRKS